MAFDFVWKGLSTFQFVYHIKKEEDRKIVSISPLTCWMKDAPTILAPSGKPTARFPNEAPPSKKLPSTNKIEWIWRQDNDKHRIGTRPISFPIYQVPTDRNVSTLSTLARERLMYELEQELLCDQWKEKAEECHGQMVEEKYKRIERKKK